MLCFWRNLCLSLFSGRWYLSKGGEGVPPPHAEEICNTRSFSSWGMVSLALSEHWTADAYWARIIQQQDMNAWATAIHVWPIVSNTCKKAELWNGGCCGMAAPKLFCYISEIQMVSTYSPALLHSYFHLRTTTLQIKRKIISQKHTSICRSRASELWAHPCSTGIHKPVPTKKPGERVGNDGIVVIRVGKTHWDPHPHHAHWQHPSVSHIPSLKHHQAAPAWLGLCHSKALGISSSTGCVRIAPYAIDHAAYLAVGHAL